MAGVAPFGLIEDPGDYFFGVVDHARGQPLVLRRWGWVSGRFAIVWADHVGGLAWRRCQVVDGADLGEAFAVAFLAFGQAGLQFGAGGLRLGCRRGAEALGTHHDPFPVGRDDHDVALVGCHWLTGRVEVLHIRRRCQRESFDLALGDSLTRRAPDGQARLLERSPRSFDRGQASQPVGVTLDGQVQLGVARIQVRVTPMPVREAGDRHGGEDARKRSHVSRLDRPMGDAVRVVHVHGPGLSQGAQLKVTLQHSSQQLSAAPLELHFELAVAQFAGLDAFQPDDQLVEARPRPSKAIRSRGAHRDPPVPLPAPRRRLRSRARPASACASSSARAVS